MITTFRTLLKLSVAHGYYNGACPDFDFIVPADTSGMLSNGKLLAKVRDGKLIVLYEADSGGTALKPLAGARLRFGIKLLNPYFSNFTDFAIPTPIYRNNSSATALDPALAVTMTGRLLSHPISRSERPVTVTISAPGGQVLQTETISAANDRSSVSCDLKQQGAGSYNVVENYPLQTKSASYYYDPELQQAGVFGVVEIRIDNGFYTVPPAFTISFDARQETLKYYLVVSNYTASEFNHLAVTDTGFSEEGRPRINFTRVPSSSFGTAEIAPQILAGAGQRLVLFKSQTAVARCQKARRKIQLSKNGDVLIQHLPQPGADRSNADVVVHVSKP